MKRLTIGLLALGFCSAGFANGAYVPPPEPINYFDGFYLGIGAGVAHTHADVTAGMSRIYHFEAGPILSSMGLDADLGEINGAGNAFVGWGNTFGDNRNGYFGVELFGRYVPTSMSVEQGTQNFDYNGTIVSESYFGAELSNHYSFGGDLRLGYLITPKVMIYALAGLDLGKFDYQVYRIETDVTHSSLDINYAGKSNTWLYGFMPGVGIEAMLTDNVSVRAQYTYTYFGDSDKVSATTNTMTIGNGITVDNSLNGVANSIQRGLFTLDLTYRFKGV